LDANKGALVTTVENKSEAQRAGLLAGDIIVKINNKIVENASNLRNQVGLLRVGNAVKLGIIRNGRKMNINMQIGKHENTNGDDININLEGASFSEFQYSNNTKRVKVNNITKNSQAWNLGLRKGDIILEINRVKIQNLKDLQVAFEQNTRSLLLKLLRNGGIINILLR
jgi:S1-C subfamily serine protease